MTYTEPPKELFSRQWYNLWNDIEETNPWFTRIRETKKKLEDLETKLRIKQNWYPTGLRTPKEDEPSGDFFIDTVSLLNSHIGVWHSTIFLTPSNLPHYITMLYPDTNRVIQTWDELVLGGVKRDGVCLIMLSPECVEWLNWVSDWASSYTTTFNF